MVHGEIALVVTEHEIKWVACEEIQQAIEAAVKTQVNESAGQSEDKDS